MNHSPMGIYASLKITKALFNTVSFGILALLFSINLYAATHSVPDPVIQKIQQQIQEISFSLDTTRVDDSNLFSLYRAIHDLQQEIQKCTDGSTQQLGKIDEIFKDVDYVPDFTKNVTQYQYLQSQKEMNLNRKAYCAFYGYKLGQIKAYLKASTKRHHLSNHFLTQISPLSFNIFLESLNFKLNPQAIAQNGGIELLSLKEKIYLGLFFVIGFIIAYFIFKKASFNKSFPPHIVLIGNAFKPYLLIILPLVFITCYLALILNTKSNIPLILLISNAFLVYCVMLFIIRLLILMINQGRSWFHEKKVKIIFASILTVLIVLFFIIVSLVFVAVQVVPPQVFAISQTLYIAGFFRIYIALLSIKKIAPEPMKQLTVCLVLFTTLILLAYLTQIVLNTQTLPPAIINLKNFIFICFFNSMWAWLSCIGWQIFSCQIKHKKDVSPLFYIFMSVLYIFSIYLAWSGYTALSIYIIPNLITTLLLFIIIIDLHRFCERAYYLLSNPEEKISQKFRALIGIKNDNKLLELMVFRITIFVPIILMACMAMMELWGEPRYQLELFFSWVVSGDQYIYHTKIRIATLFRAANMFCIMVLLGRIFSTYVAKHSLITEDKHTRVTVTSIIHYSIFILALLFSLHTAGFNFASILVISGALSVGLGFGLQHFASDFISGLFLLINKPIEIGDQVAIDNITGIVKKIGTLSTRITTDSYSDVLIPNSTLYTKTVTNYTFHRNKAIQTSIRIKVVDNEKLKDAAQILLKITEKNPDIVQTEAKKPFVLFEFNKLTVCFFIKNITTKATVLSDLHMELNKELKQANIEIQSDDK